MGFQAKKSKLQVVDGLPEVSAEELNKFNKSKLNIKDQWASHPSTEERIERLEQTGIQSKVTSSKLANEVFNNIEESQKKLTQKLFEGVEYKGETSILSPDEFKTEYEKDYLKNTFSPLYKSYYDNKNPEPFELVEVSDSSVKLSLEDLFSEENIDLVYNAFALQSDISVLEQIADKSLPVKTFDYDGKKYQRKAAKGLAKKLSKDLEVKNVAIKANDIKVYQFFRQKSIEEKSTSNHLDTLYRNFFAFDQVFEEKQEVYVNLSNGLHFVNLVTPFDEIRSNFSKVKFLEAKLKSEIEELMKDETYESEITEEMRENFELYLEKPLKYFGHESYYDKNLETLFTAMNNYTYLISRGYFILKKKLLSYQIDLVSNEALKEV
jgi:hypothetical protein